MSRQEPADPNPVVRETYERLGDFLDQGDDVFVESGPPLLQAAIERDGFFDVVESDPAPPGEYTRTKVVGDPGRHVVRFMEWPPGYTLLPHEHHGRPCFEVLVDGALSVVQMDTTVRDDGRYELSALETEVCRPGEASVVDPRENEVHAVYSPVRSRSLHVYPEDNARAFGYVLDEDADTDADVYSRECFDLDCEE